MASAAGGTSHRLKPGAATVLSLDRSPAETALLTAIPDYRDGVVRQAVNVSSAGESSGPVLPCAATTWSIDAS